MNNTWWQEFVRFFLQGITLNRLIYMLIILIILIIITPAQIKEWINFYNPEIIPSYWMYYTLLFCVSYVIASIFGATYNFIKPFYYSLLNWIYKRKAEKYIDQLTDDEKDFICLFLDLKYQ
ncbi:super-infection exclusion protein B [Arsenophonus sp. PmNCSU2021_1]|uniref:super-infection exclusion protein B n=1 Tax=Arsenophonus sp. PmNCSU2021_1 TaxID=3118989 RepID=UPI002FEF2C07